MLFVDDDDETATNSESVVSKSHLSELCSEAAKLKSMGVMNQVAFQWPLSRRNRFLQRKRLRLLLHVSR